LEVLPIILFSILFSAFFSGMEIAFLTSNKLHIELEGKKGRFAYRLLSLLNRKPARFLSALLVGNNIALVVFGLYMPELLEPITRGIPTDGLLLLIQTLLSTVVILFLAEFLPKSIFGVHADRLSAVFSFPAYLFYWLFYPIVSVVMYLTGGLLRLFFNDRLRENEPAFGRVDLDHYVKERTDNNTSEQEVDTEVQIFRNALEFSDRKAREFMIPRTEIVSIDKGSDIESLKSEFISSGLSKILIHEGSADKILGYVHSFELFSNPGDLSSILRPLSFIPESMTADDTLKLLIKERRSIAVVLDEFGGTAGLVTVEDVVEELFGEIDDEHDTEEFTEKVLAEGEYLLSARLEIDDLNEKYGLEIPESENFHTLGGWVLSHLGSIPEKGEQFPLDGFTVVVTRASQTRVEELRLKRSSERKKDDSF
jgi:CBS domain containing-hemolysin-like protein